MRVNTGQTTNLFHVQAINNSLRRNLSRDEEQAAGGTRKDQAIISSQGKKSGLLASLMNQKELIQMNKDSLIKRELGEDGSKTGNFSKQLEEYEKQLEELDEQIAREMAKQAQGDDSRGEKESWDADSKKSADESMTDISLEAFTMEAAEIKAEAQERREQEKEIAKTEQKNNGSPSANRRLNQIADAEKTESLIAPVLEKDGWGGFKKFLQV